MAPVAVGGGLCRRLAVRRCSGRSAAIAVLWEWIDADRAAGSRLMLIILWQRALPLLPCVHVASAAITAMLVVGAWRFAAAAVLRRASSAAGSAPVSAMPARCARAGVAARRTGSASWPWSLLFAVVWATDIVAYFARPRRRRSETVAARQPEEDLVGRHRRHCRRAIVAVLVAQCFGGRTA